MSGLSAIIEKQAEIALAQDQKDNPPTTQEAPVSDGTGDSGETVVEAPALVTNESLFGLNEQEQANALQLFAALKDPAQSKTVIAAMAQMAGISETSTPKEIKAAKSEALDTLSVLAEELGKDLDFLAPKLAAAFDKILATKLNESLKPVQEDIASREQARVVSETNTAFDNIKTKFYGGKDIPTDIQAEMSKVMDVFKPVPNMAARDYITDVYNMAMGRKNQTSRPSTEGRTNQNRTDVASRLASSPGAKPQQNGATVQDTDRSLKQIVQDAADKASQTK